MVEIGISGGWKEGSIARRQIAQHRLFDQRQRRRGSATSKDNGQRKSKSKSKEQTHRPRR